MKRLGIFLAAVLSLALAGDAFASALRQRSKVKVVEVQQVKVQKVVAVQKVQKVVAVQAVNYCYPAAAITFYKAPVQTFTAVPYYAAPAYAPQRERVIEKFEDGQLRERIVER